MRFSFFALGFFDLGGCFFWLAPDFLVRSVCLVFWRFFSADELLIMDVCMVCISSVLVKLQE
jgi:hypothetical protein